MAHLQDGKVHDEPLRLQLQRKYKLTLSFRKGEVKAIKLEDVVEGILLLADEIDKLKDAI